MKIKFILYFVLCSIVSFAQSNEDGVIQGQIVNAKNNQAVPFANVVVYQTSIGSATDLNGNFRLKGISPGFIRLQVSAVGFETYFSGDIMITRAKEVNINIALSEANIALDEVVVKPSAFKKDSESPVSLRVIGLQEIERIPGANRDISRVIQSFPGVAYTPAQRNDVIVRGGGPSENSFFLDDVEIPNINHFATQGASGGPVGIINVDFVRGLNLYTGAFPANRGDALSSVLEFKQKDGNKEKLEVQGTLGSSELALTLDGPISNKTTFILSVRRSYLQFLFKLLELPFLPTYNDAQFKVKTKINGKNELILIGLGALDQSRLNLDANETEDQQYILNYIPEDDQSGYTVGAVYKHYRQKSYDTWVLSRNYLKNKSIKYQNNIENDSLKILDYDSEEIENKFRYENTTRTDNNYKIEFGFGFEHARYTNDTYRKDYNGLIDYDTALDLFKYSVFGQISKGLLQDNLTLSLGVRADANTYSSSMNNLLDQLSPRFSVSYKIVPKCFVNFNMGRYYQLPAYTTLGYSNAQGDFINKQNGLKYISADHLVLGVEYLPAQQSQISVEAFYKNYRNYPFSVNDSIALANKGADFGVFGDEEVLSIAEGRSYGLELLVRTKDVWKINTIISYTLVRSEYKQIDKDLNVTSDFIPTSWDNKHLLNITATRALKRTWQVGLKWRFVGGSPYTPTDLYKTSLIEAWDIQGREYLDYSKFNTKRLKNFHQLDIRIDKQFFYNRWSLMLYLDIQNVYNFKADQPSRYVPQSDSEGNYLVDPSNPNQYLLKIIDTEGGGTILPSIGIIVQF